MKKSLEWVPAEPLDAVAITEAQWMNSLQDGEWELRLLMDYAKKAGLRIRAILVEKV